MLKIIVIYRKSGFNYSKVIIIGGGEVQSNYILILKMIIF